MKNDPKVDAFFQMIADFNRIDKGREMQENLKGERYLMLYLKNHGGTASPSEICSSLGVTNARIAAITKSLEQKVYIVRIPSKIDRRRIALSMTEAGAERVERRGRELHAWLKGVFEKLGEKDTDELLRIMKRFIEIIDK